MIVYLIIAVLLIYAIVKEREALGCPDFPDLGECNNQMGKAVYGTKPSYKDSNETLFSKIEKGAEYQNRFVFWRVAIITSFIGAFILWFVLFQKIPSEKELLIIMLVFSSIIYFTNNFYKFHLSDHVKRNIVKSVDILKSRTSIV